MFLDTYAENALTFVITANLFHAISTLCAYTRAHRLARWEPVCVRVYQYGECGCLSDAQRVAQVLLAHL